MTTGRINQVAAFKELNTRRPKPPRERIQIKKQHRNTKPVLEPDQTTTARKELQRRLRTEPRRKASLNIPPARTSDSEKSRRQGRLESTTTSNTKTLPQERLSRQQVQTRRRHPGVRGRSEPDWQMAVMNECTSCNGTSSSSFADLEPKGSQAARRCQSSRPNSNH